MQVELRLFTGVLLVFFATNMYMIYGSLSYKKPVPYTSVVKNTVTWGVDRVDISYNFKKVMNCDLRKFSTLGLKGATWDYLEYTDYDPLAPPSREPGEHTLNIGIITGGVEYDKIQVRTEHDCVDSEGNLVKINKVFLTLNKGELP